MAEPQTTPEAGKTPKAPKPKLAGEELAKKRALRRKLRTEGRKKRATKRKTDPAGAKAMFDARSKRSIDKKQAFRKKKNRKK